MSMSSEVYSKMEYIQKVFLGVRDYMERQPGWEELIAFLDSEPPEFRSVAYESASMEVGLRDLSRGTGLEEWKRFYQLSGSVHTFHMDIGLGWAFAKAGISPASYPVQSNQPGRWMVWDGVGYYYGLFRGRRTVKNQLLPEGIEGPDRQGFDQGLGRRLWYIAKGSVEEATEHIAKFPSYRHADLWRGIGVACAYVGGSKQENLRMLLAASTKNKRQLSTGVVLAVLSRMASNSMTKDIETACQLICRMNLEEVISLRTALAGKSEGQPDKFNNQWIELLEAEFL